MSMSQNLGHRHLPYTVAAATPGCCDCFARFLSVAWVVTRVVMNTQICVFLSRVGADFSCCLSAWHRHAAAKASPRKPRDAIPTTVSSPPLSITRLLVRLPAYTHLCSAPVQVCLAEGTAIMELATTASATMVSTTVAFIITVACTMVESVTTTQACAT
mgnify:CR=1 FL=1